MLGVVHKIVFFALFLPVSNYIHRIPWIPRIPGDFASCAHDSIFMDLTIQIAFLFERK
jgi:hypothetical protein